MSCDGFEHGMRVVSLEDFAFDYTKIWKGMPGVIRAVYKHNHQVDVEFPDIGIIKGLPAHRFVVIREKR